MSLAYVGTRDRRRLRRHQPELRGVGRRRRSASSSRRRARAAILDWGSITRSRYHSLQMAINRPFKNGLLLKGAYTWSKAMNETDDDGWAT